MLGKELGEEEEEEEEDLLLGEGRRDRSTPLAFMVATFPCLFIMASLEWGVRGGGGYKEHINPQPLLNYGMQLSCMWIFIG